MKSKNNLITSIDIGTTKIICLIAIIDSNDNLKIIGHGHNSSSGFRGGKVTDIKLAENSLFRALNAAEKMAGINIEEAIININCDKVESTQIESTINLSSNPITDRDIDRLIEQALEQFNMPGYELINYFPTEYYIDNEYEIKDPRLMFGNIFGCKLNLVTVSSNVLLNLINCFARCHVKIQDFILSSHASSLACLTKDEMEIGSTLIDIGGSTTSISIFKGHNIIHSGIIMLGGSHITSDIAYGLSISIEEAERIKILYGKAINTSFGDYEVIDLSSHSEHEIAYVRTGELIEIIRPRVEEILELVKIHLEENKVSKILTKRIILTGGTSQLIGIKEIANATFDANTRIGFPKAIKGLPTVSINPIFSVAIGMLIYAHNRFLQVKYRVKNSEPKKFSYLKKFFNWF